MRRAYHVLMESCGSVSALLLGIIAVLVTVDIVSRNLGTGSFGWIVEITEYSLALTTFLAAPWILYKYEHVRLDVVLKLLPVNIAHWLERLADAVGLMVCAAFFVFGVKVMLESARSDSIMIKSLVFPEWWLFLPVPFCFGLLGIEFLRRIAGGVPVRTER